MGQVMLRQTAWGGCFFGRSRDGQARVLASWGVSRVLLAQQRQYRVMMAAGPGRSGNVLPVAGAG
jgi:hypothetical protein